MIATAAARASCHADGVALSAGIGFEDPDREEGPEDPSLKRSLSAATLSPRLWI